MRPIAPALARALALALVLALALANMASSEGATTQRFSRLAVHVVFVVEPALRAALIPSVERLQACLDSIPSQPVSMVEQRRASVFHTDLWWTLRIAEDADTLEALRAAVTSALSAPDAVRDSQGVVAVPTRAIEVVLERAGLVSGADASDANAARTPHAVIVLATGASGPGRRYGYAAEGGAVPAAGFVASGRYVVVDLSAGPSDFGPLGEHQSACLAPLCFPHVSAATLERLRAAPAPDATARPLIAYGVFASLAQSAVAHVFAPDIWSVELEDAATVLVPVLALRDEPGGSPLALIDLDRVREALTAMLLPHQRALLVPASHALADHKHLAMALHKAVRSRTRGAERSRYIDSRVLLRELAEAADVLGGGLVDGLSPYRHLLRKAAQPDSATAPDERVRVLPVFVLALSAASLGSPLLLDGEAPLRAFAEGLIVLAPRRDAATELPFFSGAASVRVPAEPTAAVQHTTRLVVAGLWSALANVAPPYVRYAPEQSRVERQFRWAVGAHPFGVLGNTSAPLSAALGAHVARNFVLAALHRTLVSCRETVAQIERAARELLYEASRDTTAHEFDTSAGDDGGGAAGMSAVWLERLTHLRFSEAMLASPLIRATVARLHDRLEELGARVDAALARAAAAAAGPDVALVAEARALQAHASAFAASTHEELHRVRVEMQCCRVSHEPAHDLSGGLVAGIAIIVLASAVLAAVLRSGVRPQ